MYTRSLAAVLLGLGILASSIRADTLEFASPLPNSHLTAGQNVRISYKVHRNGMARLMWAKVHLMTDDGYDAGTGTISTATPSDWQDSQLISSDFTVPENLPSGKYVFHVYGSTQQPCEGSVDTGASRKISTPIAQLEEDNKGVGAIDSFQLRKRNLYAGRNLRAIGQSDYLLQDSNADIHKMLYFFSLI
ncbi:hypothetical protein BC939DRAFT_482353 [Gamsiella multidivaricata]|uniref:uncharacterized protein n=1 Tax=Gamsiella multidivaricata TaxID=101098 RepID=UPI0022208AEE|nr:uncharacterized protein BC939DRAFT_482353 [Gamsiella multidivaricata]KAI7816052.1 hypothetical protein BC939DRAFT_482353 [Gamsiella multidivaricata]